MTKFKKGQSGNPSGRPVGQPNKLTQVARQLLEDNAADVLQAAINTALAGDSGAQKLVLGLALPKRIRPALQISNLDSMTGITEALQSLLLQTAAGHWEVDDARMFAGLLESAGQKIEAQKQLNDFYQLLLDEVGLISPELAQRITERLAKLDAELQQPDFCRKKTGAHEQQLFGGA